MSDDEPDEAVLLMVEIESEVRRAHHTSGDAGYVATCRGTAHFVGGKVVFVGENFHGSIQDALRGATDDVQAMLQTWQDEGDES